MSKVLPSPKTGNATKEPSSRIADAREVATSLPPLLVNLYGTDGQVLHVVEIPDPRAAFCEHYNNFRAYYDPIASPCFELEAFARRVIGSLPLIAATEGGAQ